MRRTGAIRIRLFVIGLWFLVACTAAEQSDAQCAADNAGLTLPDDFCASVFADGVVRARHLTVAANGDVFVATGPTRNDREAGGVVALRDSDGDGVADVRESFGSGVGDDVEFHDGYLYYSTHTAVMRYPFRRGALQPSGPADTVVSGLPAGSHAAKSLAFGEGNALLVNIGSPSNSCQVQDRTAGSVGKDPCDELATRAGIWRFAADRVGQTPTDGVRFATGLRNTVALTSHPTSGIYGAVHGRDQLGQNWPQFFNDEQSAEKPAEEFVRIDEGDDFGWPYCYHDPQSGEKVLAPEYGGDGSTIGRCQDVEQPLIAFPAHWAPIGLVFYTGEQFPERYRGGAFIAFHGSWNRAPLPQGGYNVVFAPFDGELPAGDWEVFADGFAGGTKSPRDAAHRPAGIAQGPDGSLYVSDDQGARIYKIVYRGSR